MIHLNIKKPGSLGQIRGSWLGREDDRQESRIQEPEFRIRYSPSAQAENIKCVGAKVTTHVVRLKLFRLKAEGVRKARLPYFGGNI
jgi:hypothetical protein